jgi:hypothetical protein
MNYANKSDLVREKAKGRWLEILEVLAPDLKPAIKNHPNHVLDPVHGGKNGDGFRLFEDAKDTGGGISNHDGAKPDGFSLLMWVTNSDFRTVLNDVADYLGINNWKREVVPKAAVRSEHYSTEGAVMDKNTLIKRRKALRHAWKGSYALSSPKAEIARYYLSFERGLYLNYRTLDGLSKTMRFHPSLELWHKKKLIGRYPAIISMISYENGEPATLHRTYLNHDGSKLKLIDDEGKSISPKKLMGRCDNKRLSGGSIQLGKPEKILHVTEGIENALSVMQVQRQAVWSCVSSTLLMKFEPPKGIEHVFIWADKDRPKVKPNGETSEAGLDAAMTLLERLLEKNIKATIIMPTEDIPDNEKGLDWNDVLIRQGSDGFPSLNHYLCQ